MTSPFKSTIGAAGITYRSIPEAAISHPFLSLGIVSRDNYYPIRFTDAEGTTFSAMSDFQCPDTQIFFEFKNGYLNGLKYCSSAASARARFEVEKIKGYVHKGNEAKKTLECSWSASAPKFALVQNQLAAAGRCAVMVYDVLPDEDTVGRLSRSKAFWCVFKDPTWQALMSFRTLAKHGFQCSYEINGHTFTGNGGMQLQ